MEIESKGITTTSIHSNDIIPNMKKVYFVRHGESEGNVGIVVQNKDSALTEQGVEQAKIIAQRISKIDFDVLISSPYLRAKQTAQFISDITKKDFIESDLFIERVRPTEQIGYHKNSEAVLSIQKEYENAFVANDKYEDGESFKEIHDRAQKALHFLENYDAEHIVVVTHGMFLRVICAVILLKQYITPETCFECMKTLKTKNTGVTVIEKDEDGWRLTVWNDHAHFAEY